MPRWPSDWLGLSPEASHTARVAGSHRTNGFGFSNTVELVAPEKPPDHIHCKASSVFSVCWNCQCSLR
ncbi:hypothetical protein BRN54_11640 [Xanthomonas oryzae pv. oryzae]|nr:hypothetical protein BRN83_10875 [Xanthomonas oryzae pv. oryzae]RBB67863.1 hypothetical protein BRN54_11640 [Xanthomonas oryzae pv. oryzae]RBJ21686.1 hypothetical protein BRO08_06540 [Xanthomonas oryzae pv. oryzae]